MKKLFLGADPVTGSWISACFEGRRRALGLKVPFVTGGGPDWWRQADSSLAHMEAPPWWSRQEDAPCDGWAHGTPRRNACYKCAGEGVEVGAFLARIGWTTKCPIEIQNLHRKAWGMELKACLACGQRRLPRGIKGQGISLSHGDRWRIGLRDVCGKCMRLPAENLAARTFALKARGGLRGQGYDDLMRLNVVRQKGVQP